MGSAQLHASRAVARRTERRLVALSNIGEIDISLVRFLNRYTMYSTLVLNSGKVE